MLLEIEFFAYFKILLPNTCHFCINTIGYICSENQNCYISNVMSISSLLQKIKNVILVIIILTLRDFN